MLKRNAVYVLGNSPTKAAQAMGCSRQNVAAWQTDKFGHLTSRRVVDGVLAALVRKEWALAHGQEVEFVKVDDQTMADLMTVPAPRDEVAEEDEQQAA
ncbi:hypothetical protein GCM10028796_46990 [Ramlibacter monticola]|uniref:Uncharacterized protein n=1 Tax=Ramlibacter monticola TaxID=1926872 RepID=A0A937CW06_9BURK|nr:hypothetical protein [Ramlibacter monticola]MBL0394323.1 hypothetical protein [Ramlibacter monticola]